MKDDSATAKGDPEQVPGQGARGSNADKDGPEGSAPVLDNGKSVQTNEENAKHVSNQTSSLKEPTTEDKRTDDNSSQGDRDFTLYLEDCQIVASDSYQGNQGDSFVDIIGTNRFTRGRIDVDGNAYQHGIEAWIARWNYEDEQSWAFADFNVEGRYMKVSGKVVLIDSYNTTKFDSTLNFYGDGKLIKSYNLRPDAIPFDFDVDIEGVNTLRIYVNDEMAVSGGTSFGLVECVLQR